MDPCFFLVGTEAYLIHRRSHGDPFSPRSVSGQTAEACARQVARGGGRRWAAPTWPPLVRAHVGPIWLMVWPDVYGPVCAKAGLELPRSHNTWRPGLKPSSHRGTVKEYSPKIGKDQEILSESG